MTEPTVTIGERRIGADEPPYIIAEMSGNHNGDLGRALALIDAAKEAGADAVKLQTYRADTITINHDGPGFVIEGGLWNGRKLYDLYSEAGTPWEWHEALFEHARKVGIAIFSSPFDETAVDLLESLGAPAFKIASFELVDLPLVERVARVGKPMIVSTGMASDAEIQEAVKTARNAGCPGVVVLHCISGYPTPVNEANLHTIPYLAELTGEIVGLSDHTMGVAASVAAIALGARVIEKHFTLARADGGPDSAFSLEPSELKLLCDSTRDAFLALGAVRKSMAQSEASNRTFRRSLYVVRDVRAGEPFTRDNVRSIRPGYGLPPKFLPEVLGHRATQDVSRGTPLSWDIVRGAN